MRDSKCHGLGITVWPDGQRFEGEFKDDKIWAGLYTYKDGKQSINTYNEKNVKVTENNGLSAVN